MSEELIPFDNDSSLPEIRMSRTPESVIADAERAAKVLISVVNRKPKKVIINGEQYLEFEQWQTVGQFYGCTARVAWTKFLDLGGVHGYESGAEVLDRTGRVISTAESMCLNDEENWSTRQGKPVPLFQLRSMAQTRACAKALRNVFAWVVVLAGYRPTPAEEMTGNEQPSRPLTPRAPIRQEPVAQSTPFPPIRGLLEQVSVDTGKGPKGTWTKYGALINGNWYNTFDGKLGREAEALKGKYVMADWEQSGKYTNLVGIKLAPKEEFVEVLDVIEEECPPTLTIKERIDKLTEMDEALYKSVCKRLGLTPLTDSAMKRVEEEFMKEMDKEVG